MYMYRSISQGNYNHNHSSCVSVHVKMCTGSVSSNQCVCMCATVHNDCYLIYHQIRVVCVSQCSSNSGHIFGEVGGDIEDSGQSEGY